MFPFLHLPIVRSALPLGLLLSLPWIDVPNLQAQVPGGVSDSLVFHLWAEDVLDTGGSPSPASGDSVAVWNDVSGTASEHDFTDAVDVGTFGDLTPPLFAPGDAAKAINYRPVVDFSGLDAGLSTPDDAALNTATYDLKSFSLVFRTSTVAGSGTEIIYEEGGTVNGLNVYTRNGVLGVGGWASGAGSAFHFGGQLAEMVYHNQAWNTAERAHVESGLAIRYGVPLTTAYVDAGGGTLWDPAANAGFIEGVTAIPLSGWAFYRIRQVDRDGTEDHSVVRAVRLDGDVPLPAVWPNPAAGPVQVRFEAAAAGTVHWRLVDRGGRPVASGEGEARPGDNRWTLDAGTPAAGLYLLELRGADGRVLLRESVAFTAR